MEFIIMEYLGKKQPFTLAIKGISRAYEIKGPASRTVMVKEDAAFILAENPKMFKALGVAKVSDEDKTVCATQEVPAAPDPTQAGKAAGGKNPPAPSGGTDKTEGDDIDLDTDTGPSIPAATIQDLMSMKVVDLKKYAADRPYHWQFADDDTRMPIIKKIKELDEAEAQKGNTPPEA